MAERHLGAVIDLYVRGMREPLPLYCRTSAAWAEAAMSGRDPERAAGAEWTSNWGYPKEDKEPEHALVLGDGIPLDDMLARSGTPDPDEADWESSEHTRFGVYARRLWDGLLAHEQIADR